MRSAPQLVDDELDHAIDVLFNVDVEVLDGEVLAQLVVSTHDGSVYATATLDPVAGAPSG